MEPKFEKHRLKAIEKVIEEYDYYKIWNLDELTGELNKHLADTFKFISSGGSFVKFYKSLINPNFTLFKDAKLHQKRYIMIPKIKK